MENTINRKHTTMTINGWKIHIFFLQNNLKWKCHLHHHHHHHFRVWIDLNFHIIIIIIILAFSLFIYFILTRKMDEIFSFASLKFSILCCIQMQIEWIWMNEWILNWRLWGKIKKKFLYFIIIIIIIFIFFFANNSIILWMNGKKSIQSIIIHKQRKKMMDKIFFPLFFGSYGPYYRELSVCGCVCRVLHWNGHSFGFFFSIQNI